jgi:hypothetical protein
MLPKVFPHSSDGFLTADSGKDTRASLTGRIIRPASFGHNEAGRLPFSVVPFSLGMPESATQALRRRFYRMNETMTRCLKQLWLGKKPSMFCFIRRRRSFGVH